MARGAKPGERRGGRQKGTPNKRTTAMRHAAEVTAARIAESMPAAFDGDAHALLVHIYKDPSQPLDVRIDAAKAALRFEKPALASSTLDASFEHLALGARIKQARQRTSSTQHSATTTPV